jgi:hypothetical protein
VRTTITADETSNVDVAIDELRAYCSANGVAVSDTELLVGQLRAVLTPLIVNGKMLSAQGSQLKVERDIRVGENTVRLNFGSGAPRSGWRKIIDGLFG